MFLAKEEVKKKVKDIISDDVDNDIIFIVANKGLGKTELLKEIYGSSSFNKRLIVADGNNIVSNAGSLKKCFVDGILSYVERNNSSVVRIGLCKQLRSHISISETVETIFTNRRKIAASSIAKELCSLPLEELKMIYYKLAERMPLVIVSPAMELSDEEICYLKSLPNDFFSELGARITFVIAIRTNPHNLETMYKITESKNKGVWIMPLLPGITREADVQNPRSMASIYVSEVGEIGSLQDLRSKVYSNRMYFDTYDIIRTIHDNSFEPRHLFILANQEMSLSSYEFICDITKKIYKKSPSEYEKEVMLPHDGKILWLDALSYYLALQIGIDDAIAETQKFFLAIITEISTGTNRFCYGKPERNAFGSFIKDAATKKNNALADGFAKYYSDFAALADVFFSKNTYNNRTYQDSLMAIEVLDRAVLEFTDPNIDAMERIYEDIQICSVLDIGLETIEQFFKSLDVNDDIPEKTTSHIAKFLHTCMSVAYKYYDKTLIDEIIKLELTIKSKRHMLKFNFNELTKDESKSSVCRHFMRQLKESGLEIGDVIMPKKTIFLSYAQKNDIIANQIDKALQELGYDVKRDIRDVEKWESLRSFMKSIRREDYVVFLVSNTYLCRENCLYEVMQFMKDEAYDKRAFPIAILFSEEEKKAREAEGLCCSMFEADYIAEIVLYWQDRAANMEEKIKKTYSENRAELDARYREIKNMAQSASEFLAKFFGDELIGTINPDNYKIEELATQIDHKIQPAIIYSYPKG